MIKVSTTGMAVSLKTDLRFPESGQHGHGSRIIQLDAVVTGKEHSEYFGKIEMLYCKRQQGHYGTEKLKTEKIDKVILSKEQWENETGKIKLLELWNCISFEK